MIVLASARTQVADYIQTLFFLYTLVLIAYVLMSLLFTLGVRVPYSRASDAVLDFLRDLSEPLLRVFRRILPTFGGFDFSPILALLALNIVGSLLSQAVRGG